MLKGQCFCGNVRYEITGVPSSETNCHCSICRRTSGAAFVTWFSVGIDEFRITSGVPRELKSSDHAVRSFCADCGTPLTFHSRRTANQIDVTSCSLDDPNQALPRDHTYIADKLSWIQLNDGLPAFQESRPE